MAAVFVFVVGMHRSGTSAVAGALVELFGYDAIARPVDSNPRGQWERPEMRLQLDALLALNGGTWRRPSPADHSISPGPLDQVLRRSFAKHCRAPGMWKDPRLCLSIDYWLSVAADEGRESKVVFIHRHPLAVAESLQVRNGWLIERGLALWERTNRNAVLRLGGRDVAAVDYARLVADPEATLRSLCQMLDPEATFDPKRLRRAADTIDEISEKAPAKTDSTVDALCPTWSDLRGFHDVMTALGTGSAEPAEVTRILGQATITERAQATARGARALLRTRRAGQITH